MARCPECHTKLRVPADVELSDRISCESCGVELEVVHLVPLELEVILTLDDEHDDSMLDELEEDIDDLGWDDEDEADDEDEW
ncbi:MAG TPA: hypothetical protein PKH77_19680 [Anaerolineae bacterium]|nr:hypothetical protein [Anaerolineae bacterium]